MTFFARGEHVVNLRAPERMARAVREILCDYIDVVCGPRACGGRDWTVIVGPPSDVETERIEIELRGEPPAVYHLSGLTRTIWVEAPLEPDWQVQHAARLVRVLLRFHHAESGALFLHAGVVRVAGRGVLICGAKRAGKTTSILSLMRFGSADYVSNDDASVSWTNEGRIRALGWPRAVSVRGDTIEALRSITGEPLIMDGVARHPGNQLVGEHDDRPKMFYPSELAGAFRVGLVPEVELAMVVLPRFSERDAPLLTRLACERALELIAPHLEPGPTKHELFLERHFLRPSDVEQRERLPRLLRLPFYELVQNYSSLQRGAELIQDKARTIAVGA